VVLDIIPSASFQHLKTERFLLFGQPSSLTRYLGPNNQVRSPQTRRRKERTLLVVPACSQLHSIKLAHCIYTQALMGKEQSLTSLVGIQLDLPRAQSTGRPWTFAMASYAKFHQQPILFNSHEFKFNAYDWGVDRLYLHPAICDELSLMRYCQHAYGQHFDDTYPFYSEQLVQYDAVQSNSPLTAGYLPERQRPVFTLTSDSGASIQSAMSSSKGSHTCQTQQYNDWNRFNIKPYPRDLQYENTDSTFAFGMERITGDVEVGYVGEFTQISFCHGTLSILASASTPTEGPWTRFQLVITEWLRVRHTSCRDFCWRPGQAVHCTARSQRTTICSNSQHRPRRPLVFSDHNCQTWRVSQNSGEYLPYTNCAITDPSLAQPSSPLRATDAQTQDVPAMQSSQITAYPLMPLPAPSKTDIRSPRSSGGKLHTSQYLHANTNHPHSDFPESRSPSVSSVQSRHNQESWSEGPNKVLCPKLACGRHFKDLEAHMLTHQNERPEKCPILTCKYHTRGFARKYDKNRHTMAHYKAPWCVDSARTPVAQQKNALTVWTSSKGT
jgi:hypothetical protein